MDLATLIKLQTAGAKNAALYSTSCDRAVRLNRVSNVWYNQDSFNMVFIVNKAERKKTKLGL